MYLLPVIEQGPMLLIPVVTVVIVVCALGKILKRNIGYWFLLFGSLSESDLVIEA